MVTSPNPTIPKGNWPDLASVTAARRDKERGVEQPTPHVRLESPQQDIGRNFEEYVRHEEDRKGGVEFRG
jgi:hypothetical protein